MNKILAAFALALMIVGCSKSPQERSLSLYYEGVRQLDRYDLDGAAAMFTKTGEADPSSPLGYYGKGLLFERRLQYYDALNVYVSLTNTSPSFAPAYASAWRLFAHLEEWEDAAPMAIEYARLLSGDPEARLIRAEALIHIDQPGRAVQEVDSAIAAGGNTAVCAVIKAQAYFRQHKHDSAAAHYSAAVSEATQPPEFFAQAAAYLEAAGLIDSAITMGRMACQTGEEQFDLLMPHFYRTLRYNYFYEARRVIRRVQQRGAPEIVTKGMNIFYYLATDGMAEAMEFCDAYELLSSQDINDLVFDIMVRGKHSDNMSCANNIRFITSLMQAGNWDPKVQIFMQYYLAAMFNTFFTGLDGLKELNLVPPVMSNRMKIRLSTALCLQRSGQFEQFQQQMALLTKYHSGQIDWLTGFGDTYGADGVRMYDSAETYYQVVLKRDAWARPAFERAVRMYRGLGQTARALTYFDDYPHIEREYPELAILKAFCLAEADSVGEAVASFEKGFPYVKGNLKLFREMISLLDKRDRKDDIARLHQLLAGIREDNADALAIGAEFENDHGNFQNGLSLADSALAAEPGNVAVRAHRAHALYSLGRRDEAVAAFEKGLQEAEFNVETNYYYSQMLATEQTDLPRAANLARRAVFDSGHDLKVWMNLCYVYYQSGRYDLSRGEALKASVKYGTEPEPFYRIGMAMFMEGKSEAAQNLRKAIDLGLRGDLLGTARETLNRL
ncbi:MAG TPA: tetratricopeptide repeat protein [Candidatus Deferrimicrobium sp.]|nr:tetratricopeptide repeat protein [Candidatus Deferrimicrobium sp.]